jgi:1-acyl-sn-glycerol-3-phosphate acyltransferase
VSGLRYRGLAAKLPRVERQRWFLALARAYVRRKLANNFHGVYVKGLADVQNLCRNGPVIIAPNHVAWWDAFLVVLLDEALGTESYCLMDAQNLRRLPFFRWIGAIELTRGDEAASYHDLLRSLQLLSAPGRALWLFPQGRQRPPHIRPLALQSGIALLAQQSRLPVVPVSISYAYLDAPEPRIVIHFSGAIDSFASSEKERLPWRQWLDMLESRIVDGLDANDQFILENQGDYRPLLDRNVPSTDTPAGGRLLSFFAGAGRGRAGFLPSGGKKGQDPS